VVINFIGKNTGFLKQNANTSLFAQVHPLYKIKKEIKKEPSLRQRRSPSVEGDHLRWKVVANIEK
jgi:hypothetical protein